MQQVISGADELLRHLFHFLGLQHCQAGQFSRAGELAGVAERTLVTHSEEQLQRLAATYLRDAIERLVEVSDIFRNLSDAEVTDVVARLQKARQQVRDETRRGQNESAMAVLTATEERHCFAWGVECAAQERALVDIINSVRGKALDLWTSILCGDVAIADAGPSREDGLLLQSLVGASSMQCLEHWSRIRGGQRNLKTYEKYRVVALDLQALLGGQSVLALTQEHVKLYADYLGARRNGLKTVRDKLGICSTLLRSWPVPKATKLALEEWRPKKADAHQEGAARNALDAGQVGDYLSFIFNDRTLPPDDRVIVALQALSGARVEEICSLRGEQLHCADGYWVFDFAESRVLSHLPESAKTSVKPKRLKSGDSVRKIPIMVSGVRGLHERLVALKAQAGAGLLFSHLSPNKYGIYSGALSMRLNHRMDDVLGEDKRLVLESLRNTAAPTLRRANVDDWARHRFLGHGPRDIHERHYDLLTVEDFITSARAVSDFVAGSLEGRKYPSLNESYRPKRLVRKERFATATGAQKAPSHPESESLAVDEDGQRNRASDALHGADKDIGGHAPVSPAHRAIAVPRQPVMNILGHAGCTTERLERMSQSMEDQAPVLQGTAASVSEVSPEPLRPGTGALPEAVQAEVGKEPLIPAVAKTIDIAGKSNAQQLRMDGHRSNRALILDAHRGTVGPDVQEHAKLCVERDIAQTQLTQLLQPTSGQKGERGQPGARFASAALRAQTRGVDRRREQDLQFIGGEGAPSQAEAFALGDAQPTDRVRGKPTRIDRGLEHGAQVAQLRRDRLGVQRARKQAIPIRGDQAAVDLRHRALDESVERFCAGFELNDRSQRTVRIEVPPVFEDGDEFMSVGERNTRRARCRSIPRAWRVERQLGVGWGAGSHPGLRGRQRAEGRQCET